jgi:hypothetical protein
VIASKAGQFALRSGRPRESERAYAQMRSLLTRRCDAVQASQRAAFDRVPPVDEWSVHKRALQVKQSPMGMASDSGTPRVADALVDSAISHCEKLRRILELEGWIRAAHDCPILARGSERWQAEREQLLAELELSH